MAPERGYTVSVSVQITKHPAGHRCTLKRERGKAGKGVRRELIESGQEVIHAKQPNPRLRHGVIRKGNFLVAAVRPWHTARGVELESRLLKLLLACWNDDKSHIILIENAR